MEKEHNLSNKRTDLSNFVEENSSYIYSIMFYVAGVTFGVLLFKSLNLVNYDGLIKVITSFNSSSFFHIFVDKLAIYLIIYIITLLTGLCVIGFPIINVIPLVCGFEIALKLSYYYNTYEAKGIGYSILMIIPEASVLITVLILTIKTSKAFSKSLFECTTNKNNNELILSAYLKRFLFYGALIIAITSINSLLLYLLNSIISI